jgi:hypothetical protein
MATYPSVDGECSRCRHSELAVSSLSLGGCGGGLFAVAQARSRGGNVNLRGVEFSGDNRGADKDDL